MGSRDELRRRFSGGGREIAERKKRKDYKGERVQMNLRVSAELRDSLALLRIVSGGSATANEFCVTVLEEAVEKRLQQIMGNYTDAEWEVFKRCVAGSPPETGEPPGGSGDHR